MSTLTRLLPTTSGIVRRLAGSTVVRVGAIAIAGLVTLVVLVHVVEYWRGKRAWDKCRSDLIARGEVLDWASSTPPPVPDNQNIFKAPMMRTWFIGRGANEFTKHIPTLSLDAFVRARNSNAIPAIVARVTVIRPGEPIPPGGADIVLQYKDGVVAAGASPDFLPQIVIDGARLDDAVNTLARQAGLDLKVDLEDIGFLKPLPKGGLSPMPLVTVRWTNIPAGHALALLLDMHGLRVSNDPKTGVARVILGEKSGKGMPEDGVVRARLEKLLDDAVGPVANAAEGYTLAARALDQIHPVRVFVESEQSLTLRQIEGIFPPVSTLSIQGMSAELAAETTGTNSYRIVLATLPAPAADYLAWSDEVEGDYDLLREALKRPYARMGGDYGSSLNIRIPNFVALRVSAQRQSTRARCHLLLGQPEAAFRELTLVHDLNRMMEAKPSGKPMTLVAAMIEVAITGLYCAVVADGIRWKVWREPDLAAIQKQLAEVDLPPMVRAALVMERAGVCHLAETTPIADLWRLGYASSSAPGKIQDLLLQLIPRGWIYQNMVVVARLHLLTVESIDLKTDLINPAKVVNANREMDATFTHRSPYIYLAAIAIPNFTRAASNMARNQTMASEAIIACGLERHRMARGGYPATLGELVPQFVEKLPHDIIGGGPLKYRRLPNGQFLLYSIGWNETDDGGAIASKNENGDWVWDAP